MWLTSLTLRELSDWKRGMGYLLRAWSFLVAHRRLRGYVVLLTLVQLVVFLFCLLLVGLLLKWGLSEWLFASAPETWWLTLLYVLAIVIALLAAIYLGSSLFVAISMVVAAPLYEVFASQVIQVLGIQLGEMHQMWWQQLFGTCWNAVVKLLWLFALQFLLLGLYLLPFAFGPVAYLVSGLVVTTLFHAIEYLDWSFDHRGWTFKQRITWALKRKGLVFGFGLGVFGVTLIPLINILLPAVALTGSILLFADEEGLLLPQRRLQRQNTSRLQR